MDATYCGTAEAVPFVQSLFAQPVQLTAEPYRRRIDSRPLLAQRFCESNESLPDRSFIVGGKAEDQGLRVRTSQCISING
jgi:hypothetical protein